ncbi:MAG: TVP38/TMEM64 family protein [Planctomycetales bacterium]
MPKHVSPRVIIGTLLVLVLVASTILLTVPGYRQQFFERLEALLELIQRLDRWGPVAVGAAFIPACLLFLPGSPLTLFGGFAFGGTLTGLIQVTVAVSLGSTLGAALSFLTGRYVAREWVAARVAARPAFRAIDAAVGREGFRIVLLTRLSPVFPFNLLNYGFGLTGVSFRDYCLASWIGMLPGTILFVYVGSTTRQLADVLAGRAEQSVAQRVLFYVGLAATLLVTMAITRMARRALATAVPTAPSQTIPEADSGTPTHEKTRHDDSP